MKKEGSFWIIQRQISSMNHPEHYPSKLNAQVRYLSAEPEVAYIHMGKGMELLQYRHLAMEIQDNSLNQSYLQKIVSEEPIDR